MGLTRQSSAGLPAGASGLRSPDDQELTAAAMLRITLVAIGQLDAAPAGSRIAPLTCDGSQANG
jgi:hypothetical protein